MTDSRPAPTYPRAHRAPAQLLHIARQELAEATQAPSDALRYAGAHLAALRAATAVLATRPRPQTERPVYSVWALLALAAPELDNWATHFQVGAGKRAAAEAGIPRSVTAQEADDLLRTAEQFLALVDTMVGSAGAR